MKTVDKSYRLFISPGNKKMGLIPSLSFPPILSCAPSVPCKKDCYAMKAWRLYPQTRAALGGNMTYYFENPVSFRIELLDFFKKKKPEYFRFFVSGDLPDKDFLQCVDHVCESFPETSFLIFTKRHDWTLEHYKTFTKPSNLKVMLSSWPGYSLPEPKETPFPIAFMQDGNESRFPLYGPFTRCPGSCQDCKLCFDVHNNSNVVFYKH